MTEAAVAERAVIFMRTVTGVFAMVRMPVERCGKARGQAGVAQFEQQALAGCCRHVTGRDECTQQHGAQQDCREVEPFLRCVLHVTSSSNRTCLLLPIVLDTRRSNRVKPSNCKFRSKGDVVT